MIGTAGPSALCSGLERLCLEHARARGWDVAAAFVSISETARLEPVWLGGHERDRLAELHVPKRRKDWLAGRRAAKAALVRLLGIETSDELQIVPASGGAPVVHHRTEALRGVGVSISHSHDLAGALAWRSKQYGPGLDLERIVPLGTEILSFAFGGHEREYIDRGPAGPPHDVRALRLWTAKEAVLKSREVGFRWPLRSVTVHPTYGQTAWTAKAVEPGTRLESTFQVATESQGGHVIAIAFPAS